MKLTGTILGFLLGFIFGHNIVVAVVCALIGYFVFDKPRLEKNEKNQHGKLNPHTMQISLQV